MRRLRLTSELLTFNALRIIVVRLKHKVRCAAMLLPNRNAQMLGEHLAFLPEGPDDRHRPAVFAPFGGHVWIVARLNSTQVLLEDRCRVTVWNDALKDDKVMHSGLVGSFDDWSPLKLRQCNAGNV